MAVNVLFLIGRILYGGFFIYAGIHHFTSLEPMAGYANAKGVPSAKLAVTVTGVLALLGGLSILLGWHFKWGVLLLVVFLVPVTWMMHAFWKEEDPQVRRLELVSFQKNVALLGAALMILAVPGNWVYSLAG